VNQKKYGEHFSLILKPFNCGTNNQMRDETARQTKGCFYRSTVWSDCSADNIMRVLKLQKRAARVIVGAETRSNSVELFKKLAWFPFYDEVKVNKFTLVLKRLQGRCPTYMFDLLKCNADLHSRAGRYSALNLVCPRFNRETEGEGSFGVFATRLWNSLPSNLKKKGTSVISLYLLISSCLI